MTVMEMEKERSYAEAADNLWDNVIYCGWGRDMRRTNICKKYNGHCPQYPCSMDTMICLG